MQFVCSAIQAGSRLGYQESAELCAQYLAPVLDAIKFNYLPFGLNLFSTAETLPKEVAYSEPRLQPPPGYKDTTVPGILSRDTPFSHGNHEPGWVVAPGMQGVAGAAVHREHADAGVAGRADGRPGHRAACRRGQNMAGSAGRLRREQPAAAAVVSAARSAAGAGAGRDSGSAPAPAAAAPPCTGGDRR